MASNNPHSTSSNNNLDSNLDNNLTNNPFIWGNIALIAALPWFLSLSMAGLAVGEPLLPEWLEIFVLGFPPIALVAWVQWQQPFLPFSLWIVAKPIDSLSDRDRRILTFLKQQRNGWYGNGWTAITLAVVMSAIFCKIYIAAPLAQAIAPFPSGLRFFGIIWAEVFFLLSNVLLQSGISALRIKLTPESELLGLQPFPIEKIKNSFTNISWELPQLLKFFEEEPLVQEIPPKTLPKIETTTANQEQANLETSEGLDVNVQTLSDVQAIGNITEPIAESTFEEIETLAVLGLEESEIAEILDIDAPVEEPNFEATLDIEEPIEEAEIAVAFDVEETTEEPEIEEVLDIAETLGKSEIEEILDVEETVEEPKFEATLDIEETPEEYRIEEISAIEETIEEPKFEAVLGFEETTKEPEIEKILDIDASVEEPNFEEALDIKENIEEAEIAVAFDVQETIKESNFEESLDIEQTAEEPKIAEVLDIGETLEESEVEEVLNTEETVEEPNFEATLDIEKTIEESEIATALDIEEPEIEAELELFEQDSETREKAENPEEISYPVEENDAEDSLGINDISSNPPILDLQIEASVEFVFENYVEEIELSVTLELDDAEPQEIASDDTSESPNLDEENLDEAQEIDANQIIADNSIADNSIIETEPDIFLNTEPSSDRKRINLFKKPRKTKSSQRNYGFGKSPKPSKSDITSNFSTTSESQEVIQTNTPNQQSEDIVETPHDDEAIAQPSFSTIEIEIDESTEQDLESSDEPSLDFDEELDELIAFNLYVENILHNYLEDIDEENIDEENVDKLEESKRVEESIEIAPISESAVKIAEEVLGTEENLAENLLEVEVDKFLARIEELNIAEKASKSIVSENSQSESATKSYVDEFADLEALIDGKDLSEDRE